MAVWRWNGNKTGETNNAFADYIALEKGELSFLDQAKKYNIQTVLLPTPDKDKKKEQKRFVFLEKLFEKFAKKGKYTSIIDQVKQAGWQRVYHDDVAVIYQKSY